MPASSSKIPSSIPGFEKSFHRKTTSGPFFADHSKLYFWFWFRFRFRSRSRFRLRFRFRVSIRLRVRVRVKEVDGNRKCVW